MSFSDKHIFVIVVFGGNPVIRQQVIKLLEDIGNNTVYAFMSEEEGIEKLQVLDRIDLVLIGGRYDAKQRLRIREIAAGKFPSVKFSEPGSDYPYDDDLIKKDVALKLEIFKF